MEGPGNVLNVLNINMSILGHVDSGKTSLAKVLSNQASTASFDKHPQVEMVGSVSKSALADFCMGFVVARERNHSRSRVFGHTRLSCPGTLSDCREAV